MLDRQNAEAPLIAFCQIFAQNSKELPAWIEELKSLRQSHKNLIWTALWMANTTEARSQMVIVAKQCMPYEQAAIAKNTQKVVPLETMEVSSPVILDMLWADFFATGDERYVKRIMTVLPASNQAGQPGASAIMSGVAKWSLCCNAHQHQRVLEICKKEMNNQPPLREVLSQIVDKATSG